MSDFTWKSPKEGVIDARKLAGGVLLVLRAENVQRTRTGLHAKVTVAFADSEDATQATPVLSDTLNVDKESYRNDFVNVLYGGARSSRIPKFSEQFRTAYPRDEFERDVYKFSEDFFQKLMGEMKGEWVSGHTDKTTPRFLVDGLVLEEGGTILYAPPKSAKSYSAMLLAVSVNGGRNTFWNVKPTTVLYINLERGQQSMARRLGLVNRILGLPPEEPLLMLNKRGRTLADIYDAAKETVEKNNVGLVILDSLSRGGFGDLNQNDDSNRAMDYLNRLCPAWIAIAHTPRQDDSHVFGSQMFDAAMDIGVQVKRQKLPDGTLGIGFNVKDTNDTGSPPLRIMAYEFDAYGLVNVRDAHAGEFPDIEGESTSSPRTNRERVYDQFKKHSSTSAAVARELGLNSGTVAAEVKSLLLDGQLIEVRRQGNSIYYGIPARDEAWV